MKPLLSRGLVQQTARDRHMVGLQLSLFVMMDTGLENSPGVEAHCVCHVPSIYQ